MNFCVEFESCCTTALFKKDKPFLSGVSVTRGRCYHFPTLCGSQHSFHMRLLEHFLCNATTSLQIRTFLNTVQLQSSCPYASGTLAALCAQILRIANSI